MKRLCGLCTGVLLFLMVLPGTALAAPAEETFLQEEIETLEEAVPERAEEILGHAVDIGDDPESLLQKIRTTLVEKSGHILRDALKSGVQIVTIAMLCGLAGIFFDGGKIPNYMVPAAVCGIAAIALGDIHTFVGLGGSILDDLNTFSKALLPTMTTAAAASGATVSAGAKYAVTVLFMDILITGANRVILPLIYAYIAVSIGEAAFGGTALKGVSNLIKWCVTTILTVMVTVFTIYLSVTGVITATTDQTAAKLAKTVLSGSLPVVGGILSDAASVVVGGIGMIRGTIGVFGMIVICTVCGVPFLQLGVHYLIYKAAAALTEVTADSRLSNLTGAIGTAFGLILAVSGTAAILLFVSILSLLKAVTG